MITAKIVLPVVLLNRVIPFDILFALSRNSYTEANKSYSIASVIVTG